MPKNKNKKNKGRPIEMTSDDESINDNASMISLPSDNGVCTGSVDDNSDEIANVSERYEDKLGQILENATEKSAQTRVQALQSACEVMMHRLLADFIEDRKMTIIDIIEKSLRRGKGPEQAWAAQLAPLLLLQLGGEDIIAKNLNQILIITSQNNSFTFDARAKCCTALGLLNFLGGEDIGELLVHMKNFESIFAGSYLKGDQSPSSANAESGALHAAALSAWSLLLTLLPPGDFVSLMKTRAMLPSITNLMGMLQSPHLDVRMSAGEAIALVLECGRAHEDDFLEEYMPDLIETTKQLATDSHKYRAKRDRKTQRATFRDVLRYIEEDISPEINIRFGTETLLLNTWAIHHQYTALCTAIGPGITMHLAENDFLRDVLQLGTKMVQIGSCTTKQTKLEKHLINAAAFKARTISRSKNRDKRSAVVN